MYPNQPVKSGFERESILHFTMSPFVYGADEKTLHIRLRTKKGNVQSVQVSHQDPFAPVNTSTLTPTTKSGTDALFDFWLAIIVPPHRRLQYTFVLHRDDPTEVIYYNETGFHQNLPPWGHFVFSYLHVVDLYKPPAWVKETIWYQIFPERFANGDPSLNPPNTLPWGSTGPTRENFFGGDFQGVMDHIDHLISLGITGIYFTPIFHSPTNHKYDTIDYLEIDPQFGTKETFRKMVELLHQHGIRIILDCVFNHSGELFKPFVDLKLKQQNSEFKDWFSIHGFPLTTDPLNYDTFAFSGNMPKLNNQNPATREYLIKVAKYWIEEFNIDGWRLDVADEVDHNFWRDLCSSVRKIKPDCFFIGETWHNALIWLGNDQWDSAMNYPLMTVVDELFVKKESVTKFASDIVALLHWYPEQANKVMFNLLDSHDTPRLLTRVKNDETYFMLAFTFILTYPGSPCIYYGDEIGINGEQDPENRKCMEWDKSKQNLKIFQLFQKLIQIRKSNRPLTNGNFQFLEVHEKERCFSYKRACGPEEVVVVAMNLGTAPWTPSLRELTGVPRRVVDLLTQEATEPTGIVVKPNSANILKVEFN